MYTKQHDGLTEVSEHPELTQEVPCSDAAKADIEKAKSDIASRGGTFPCEPNVKCFSFAGGDFPCCPDENLASCSKVSCIQGCTVYINMSNGNGLSALQMIAHELMHLATGLHTLPLSNEQQIWNAVEELGDAYELTSPQKPGLAYDPTKGCPDISFIDCDKTPGG